MVRFADVKLCKYKLLILPYNETGFGLYALVSI